MPPQSSSTIQRRDFLKLAGAATAFSLTPNAFAGPQHNVTVLIDANDPVASSEPVKWAAEQVRKAIAARGATAQINASVSHTPVSTFFILVTNTASDLTKGFPQIASTASAESVRMTPGHVAGVPAIWVSAVDPRGFIYGLLELAERVEYSHDPALGLHLSETLEETAANKVRSVARAFCSEIEDKPWYYDKSFWQAYLDVLARSRFNRFNFAFGFGYDFPNNVTGDYFHFPYPYLVEVPGYKVQVIQIANQQGPQDPVPLSDEERNKNLEMLRFIVAETTARGLEFQLGIWTHAYQWTKSPHAHHRIDGLTPETHAAYCRDALAIILKECPGIQGLTLRVHGESGVPEGSYPFWQTLFEAISRSGRKVEIDMHSKGVNQIMIDMASKTGMPVKLGAKYAAEHQTIGYQQADIRALEIPHPGRGETGVFSVSNGARLFTRYGYADFFQQGAREEVLFRLWPGTQRHLLSGDPEMAAAFGRTSHFCGAAGLELCEPLTFKGREGSGIPGGRCAYLDTSLTPKAGDWQKFESIIPTPIRKRGGEF